MAISALLQKLNRNYRIVAFATLLSLLYLGWLATSIHEGVFFAGDQALKSMQVKQIAAGEGFKYVHLGQPEWVKSIWNEGYFPLRPPFFYPSSKRYLIVYPPLFQAATAPFYKQFGSAGLYILPMLCTLLLLGWTILLLKRCGITPVNIALAIFILVFCSPLMLYGVMFWEHLPAVLLLFAGLAFIVQPPARLRVAALLGMLCGLAVWLRPEALMMVFLYALAVGILYFRERRGIYIAFEVGAGLLILPWFLFNIAEYGALFGIHGQQVFSDNNPDTRMTFLHGWHNLTSINDISIRHFWFLLLLIPVGVRLLRRWETGDLRLALLTAIVIAYSVLTPFILPNDGIIQWGARYFLGIIPVTLVLLFLAEKKWAPFAGRKTRWWLGVLIFFAGLGSFYQNTHGGGYKELRYRYNHRLTDIYKLLDAGPRHVVIVSPHYLSYDFGYLFDRNYFIGLTGDDSLRRLLPLLKKNGVHEYIVIYSPRYHTLPPMLRDSATEHFEAEAAKGGWVNEDIASKVCHID